MKKLFSNKFLSTIFPFRIKLEIIPTWKIRKEINPAYDEQSDEMQKVLDKVNNSLKILKGLERDAKKYKRDKLTELRQIQNN